MLTGHRNDEEQNLTLIPGASNRTDMDLKNVIQTEIKSDKSPSLSFNNTP